MTRRRHFNRKFLDHHVAKGRNPRLEYRAPLRGGPAGLREAGERVATKNRRKLFVGFVNHS